MRRGHLLAALTDPGFRRLFVIRLLGQFGDGFFQTSLAGSVLFNPERQAHAADVAAGFAVVLAPYSLIGPFAGVLLDRWSRQRVLVWSNVARAVWIILVAAEMAGEVGGVAFYASALVIVSIGRFFLSALSASLPHVVDSDNLVTANALSTTTGGIVAFAGGAVAIGVRGLIGESGTDYAVIALLAGGIYLAASVPGRRFGREQLGPDEAERGARETVAAIARGLVAGARHLQARPAAAAALAVITVQRLGYGLSIVCTLLLYRNYFTSDGFFRAGLSGLAQVAVAVAVGNGLAAVVTPAGMRRLGRVWWPTVLLAAGAVVQLGFGLTFHLAPLLLAAFLLGVVAQGIKICVDTIVQQDVADAYRGRVFTLYDMLVNVTLVSAAVITAVALPDNGHSPPAVAAIGISYALTAVWYAGRARRRARLAGVSPTVSRTSA